MDINTINSFFITGSKISLMHYLLLSSALFSIAITGIFLHRRNIIAVLMAIELMLLAVNFNFIAFSNFLHDLNGQVFVFFTLTVAAAESAIGLAIIVLLFRSINSVDIKNINKLNDNQ